MSKIDFGDESLNKLILSLKKRLPYYLIEKGIYGEDPADKMDHLGLTDDTMSLDVAFHCISPDHKDNNPSMVFVPKDKTGDGEYSLVRCWSCGRKADIFQAASWLEDLPSSGPDWVQKNVYKLAERFKLEFERIQPTDEQLKKARLLQMYSDAADVLSGLIQTSEKCDPFQHTKARGLHDSVCIEWGVGTVDWDEFLSTLIAYGNTNEDDIRAAGINENMFGRDYITLTLRDHRGSVVGFDRRFVRYDSTEEAKAKIASRYYPPKFSRTPDSIGIMPDIFLYGVDKVKDFWRRVDIVEGYFDVLSGYQAGHKRIIAACGTSTLEDEHFDLLAKAGARQVGIIMDSDPAGEAATEKIIAKFSNRSDLRMSVVQLDFDENDDPKDRDPDTFFQLYGIDEFNKKKVVSSFSFQLTMQQKRGAKGIDLIRAVIPQLAAEPDAILRGLQIKDLSAKTGIHEDDIRDEVKRLLSGQAQKLANETTKALERVKTPDDVRAVVNNAMERISRLDTSKRSLIGRSAALMNFGASVDKFQAPGGALAGARTGFKLIDDYLGGFPKNGFCVIGGTPNSGKTALANNLIYGMLENISPDHTLLIHSLDDNYAYAFAKLVSIRIRMPIGHCACPEAYIYKVPELTKKYDEALTWLRGLVEDGHLYIFGAESGMNMDTIKRSVGLAQDETGRHVTLVVDSFHNIIGPPGEEERSRYESVSKSLHHMAATGTSVIVTAECNKTAQGQKPRMKDLSETRALSYDANLILVPYNELNEKREDAANYWVGKTSMGNQWVKKPVIELEVEKNKITDFKGTFYYRFIDYECRFEEIPDIKAFMGLQNQEWINHQSGRDGMMPPTIVGDTSAVQTRRQSVLESISHDSRETVSPTFG